MWIIKVVSALHKQNRKSNGCLQRLESKLNKLIIIVKTSSSSSSSKLIVQFI